MPLFFRARVRARVRARNYFRLFFSGTHTGTHTGTKKTSIDGFDQMSWVVTKEDSGLSLVAFIQSKLAASLSARQIKRSIENNACIVNGKPERFASAKVGTGDHILFEAAQSQKHPSVQILYEDDSLLICNKPANIASDSPFLQTAIRNQSLFLAHRLDKQTTGALIFAKNRSVLAAMETLFKKREVEKEYLALVDGEVQGDHGTVDNYLGVIRRYQGQTIWGETSKTNGLHAVTAWMVDKKCNSASLLRCFPKTGRTHQLRVHLKALGHGILGDVQYNQQFQCSFIPKRHLLHAQHLTFYHPITGQKVSIEAPLPDDFEEALERVFACAS